MSVSLKPDLPYCLHSEFAPIKIDVEYYLNVLL